MVPGPSFTLLDTGSQLSMAIDGPFFISSGLKDLIGWQEGRITGMVGSISAVHGVNACLELSGREYALTNIYASVAISGRTADHREDIKLGNRFLSNFDLLFDASQGVVYFIPNRPLSDC